MAEDEELADQWLDIIHDATHTDDGVPEEGVQFPTDYPPLWPEMINSNTRVPLSLFLWNQIKELPPPRMQVRSQPTTYIISGVVSAVRFGGRQDLSLSGEYVRDADGVTYYQRAGRDHQMGFSKQDARTFNFFYRTAEDDTKKTVYSMKFTNEQAYLPEMYKARQIPGYSNLLRDGKGVQKQYKQSSSWVNLIPTNEFKFEGYPPTVEAIDGQEDGSPWWCDCGGGWQTTSLCSECEQPEEEDEPTEDPVEYAQLWADSISASVPELLEYEHAYFLDGLGPLPLDSFEYQRLLAEKPGYTPHATVEQMLDSDNQNAYAHPGTPPDHWYCHGCFLRSGFVIRNSVYDQHCWRCRVGYTRPTPQIRYWNDAQEMANPSKLKQTPLVFNYLSHTSIYNIGNYPIPFDDRTL
tara:strand:- start:968 stop:2191 length:1224 start_codon:yes stop_codon:yes gene_type:complete